MSKLTSIGMLLFCCSLFCGTAYAASGNALVAASPQSEQCAGVVVDENGEGVIGASVAVKGTTQGVSTDFDGSFTIANVKPGSTLVISYIGYNTQEVVWNGAPLTVALKENDTVLQEVVVTALGIKREKKALGYAVTELKGDELNTAQVNPVNALQGKVAGVEIAQSDGGMFGSTKIQIRGASTLGKNNQPIYVIDGVILDNSIKEGSADWDGTNYGDYGNELKNLNPDDFETVSVLKGAAATALYGSRGLNGAVVITTKSGKGKKGIGVNVVQTFGIDHMFKQPDLQYVHGNGQYGGNVTYGEKDPKDDKYYTHDNNIQFYLNGSNQHTVIGSTGRHWGPAFDGSPIEYYDGEIVPYSPVKNNMKKMYNLGFNSNTNVSVQGGNEKTSFYASLSYKHMSGTLPNNSFKRLAMMGKASHKVTSNFEVEASINFSNSNPHNAQPSVGEYFVDSNNGPLGAMYDPDKYKHLYKASHGGVQSSGYGDKYGRVPGMGLWWSIYENNYDQKETSVRPGLKLTWDITSWLTAILDGNFNYYYRSYENKQPGSGYANEGGYYGLGQYKKEQTNVSLHLNATKQLNQDFEIHGFLRGEYYHNTEQAHSAGTNGGLIVPNKYFIGNSKNTPSYSATVGGGKTIWSVAFQAGASWRNQIYLDVTGRNDWSSALVYSDGHGNYSYFYPSVSGSWLVSETFRDVFPSWISFGKIRASWAQVGNDTDPYSINSAFNLWSSTTNAGTYYTLEVPNTAYSQDLKPERKNSWEVGLDWRFLNNRLGLDFTYYKENTTDQIMSIKVPYQSGISNQLVNAGNIQNSGIEVALNTTPVQTKDWQWDLNFTYTRNRGKIISLHPNVAEYIALAGDVNYGNFRIGSVAKVGGDYGLLMSDSAPEIDPNSGLPFLQTYDWDETSGEKSMRAVMYKRTGTVQEVGSMQPDFLGSVNTTLRWKDLSLYVALDMRFGGYVASYASRYGTAYGMLKTSLAYSDPEHGGITYKSIWNGREYTDGYIPEGIFKEGTSLATPNGEYIVAKGGETYQQLYDKGLVDPQHASTWHYWHNSWGNGTLNDDWFKKLNYIALREITLSYRMPTKIAEKIRAKNIFFSLSGRNLGYLLNSMPNNINPESIRGTVASEFRVRSFSGYTANYTFTINVSF